MPKIKKIFLTGGDGFIGRNVLEQLRGKYTFFAPSHKDLELLDITSVENYFSIKGPFDVVVHCAFMGGPRNFTDTAETFRDNIRIFLNIVRNSKYFGKFINLGSGAEYGKQRPILKISESDFGKVVPIETDYYGLAKYVISKFIENFDNFVNLRLFGVWGKYENSSLRFISNAICKSILDMPITINKNVYFDYLYIDDFVDVLNYFLNHKVKHKSYNVATGISLDLLTIANAINKISGKKLQIKVRHRGLANEYTASINRLTREIGTINFTHFDKSLTDLYNWYFEKSNLLERENYVEDYFK